MKFISSSRVKEDLEDSSLFNDFVGLCVGEFLQLIMKHSTETIVEKYRIPDEVASEVIQEELVLIKNGDEDVIQISYDGIVDAPRE